MIEKITKNEAIEQLYDALKNSKDYFIQVHGSTDWSEGWKISIQGHTLEDSQFIFESLFGLLGATKVSFKLGTQKLIDMKTEQSTKLLTIYLPKGVDPKSYAELVRLNLEEYTGADDIEEKRSYTKYAPGIFYRNDRDEKGEYIPA